MPSYTDVFKEIGLELNDAATPYWTSAFVERYHLSVIRRGAKSTLQALVKRHTLVCTTSRETQAEVIRELEFLQMDKLFHHIVTRNVAARYFELPSLPFFPYHEQRRKLYQCALAVANCAPENTVVIGDMGMELKPAKELGITTIGLVTYESRKKELQATSDFLISSITQLQNMLLK